MTTATLTNQGRTARRPPPGQAKSRIVSEELQALWAMTAAERVVAMWRSELTLRQLCHWSSRAPTEVPLLAGEFAWIVMRTPDWAEADDGIGKAA